MTGRFSVARSTILIVLLFWFAAGWGGCLRSDMRQSRQAPAAVGLPRPVRAVWVARFHYRYADDIRTIMKNCRRLGFNTVLWQVRGNGTTAYPSSIEPWAKEFDHRDPGFDPLALAVSEAHKQGLRIEAWVNVLPGWRGPKPPPIRSQLYHARPEWFMYDAEGRRQPLDKFYAIINPCLPEVRRYLVSVFREIVTKYDVDGLHLDYVRYAWETTPRAKQIYPRDPATLALYRRDTGKHPDDDSRAWDRWRADRLTQLVASIREMLGRERPDASLTAAVTPDPALAYSRYHQSGADWLAAGLLDAVMPMTYVPELQRLERYVQAYKQAGRVIPGLGVYKLDHGQFREQLRRCEQWGGDLAAFSYTSFHATADNRGAPLGPHEQTLRADRRRAIQSSLGGYAVE
ncbi:MAG: family 10 glycosylhydrolase [Planctomycetes bacterium]|nr:family 10 glycosylhydrolase [Planctomycetota bacterium]